MPVGAKLGTPTIHREFQDTPKSALFSGQTIYSRLSWHDYATDFRVTLSGLRPL